ncbi:MAG: DUF1552 domain-containing protein [Deltaproteobacteria bacterium]|nr:DUF1552 domain-containing protein [Deltaproteobacteria bacterium]
MTVRKIGRRFFLIGAGGAALAIPALPSLLRGTRAEAQDPAGPKRMVAIMSEHGGVWQEHMFPDAADAAESFEHLHTCHHGLLASRMEGSDRVVSDVLRAPADRLTESLVQKMNVIRGLDVPFYYGHARHVLGNYGDMSNNHDDPTPEQATVDVVMGYSSSFYESVPRRRMMNFGRDALSVEWVDPVGRSGGFQPVPTDGAATLFDLLYVEPETGEERPPPLNQVMESYRRLESGAHGPGARLGSADRAALRQYMDRLSDLQSSLNTPTGAHCGSVVRPEGVGNSLWNWNPSNYQILNDVIMAGFMCDSSRIAVIRTTDPWHGGMDADGGYHEVAHNAAGGGGSVTDGATLTRLEGLLTEGNNALFRDGMLDLVNKLEALPEGEGSMLDSTVVWWAHEAGASTHNGDSIPIVSIGGGNMLNTGHYLDMRDRNANPFREDDRVFKNVQRRRGACFFQWHTTILDAMGIPRSEWQVDGRTAFSGSVEQPGWMTMQYDQDALFASCDDPLPYILG